MNLQHQFIHNLVWTNTLYDAFRRANIYRKDIAEESNDKKLFKQKLKQTVLELEKQYTVEVSEEQHLANIWHLSEQSVSPVLNGDKLNFGVSQKLLNVYLKYQWCNGKVATPPHFPVDRLIQVALECKHIVSWTQMTKEEEYYAIINHAKGRLEENNCTTLAELELILFEKFQGRIAT